jgi:hypothetical protein
VDLQSRRRRARLDELKKSIESLAQKPDLADGYEIARRTYYQGRWIRGGGWYPDRQLRLFRKAKGTGNNVTFTNR